MDPTGWIDLVLARAGELRAAGVLSIGPQSATFAPMPAPVAVVGDIDKADDTIEPRNFFDDPASYPGGEVPGFKIEHLPRGDDF